MDFTACLLYFKVFLTDKYKTTLRVLRQARLSSKLP